MIGLNLVIKFKDKLLRKMERGKKVCIVYPLAPAIFLKLLPAFLLVLLLSAPTLSARPEPNSTGPEAGRELAAELRSMRPEEDTKWQGTLKFSRNHKTTTIPIFCKTTLGESNSGWTVMYLTSATDTIGAEELRVICSTNGPNQYIFAVAATPGAPLGEPKQLSGGAADIPLAGSDFWLSDLGLDFYHWPQQERLPGDRRRGRACFVLRSINPHPSPQGYAWVKTWIDQESGAPLEAIAYGPDNKEVKEFEVGGVKKVNGHWELKDIKMTDLRTGSKTRIEFDLKSK